MGLSAGVMLGLFVALKKKKQIKKIKYSASVTETLESRSLGKHAVN